MGTATKLTKTWKLSLETSKEGMNNTANVKGSTDGQTWRRLKRIAIVMFENLLAQQFSEFIFAVCNVSYNACETCFLDTKVNFVVHKYFFKFHSQ